jgi:hypothetical protein
LTTLIARASASTLQCRQMKIIRHGSLIPTFATGYATRLSAPKANISTRSCASVHASIQIAQQAFTGARFSATADVSTLLLHAPAKSSGTTTCARAFLARSQIPVVARLSFGIHLSADANAHQWSVDLTNIG